MTKRTSVTTEATSTVNEQPAPQAEAAWSDIDESTYQALLARRRAAKVKSRSGGPRARLTDAAMLVVGSTPAEGKSVLATVRAAVAAHGEAGVARGVLLDELAKAKWESVHARPSDRGWLAGWLSGAVRQGVVAVKPSA